MNETQYLRLPLRERRLAQEREDADPPEEPTAPNFNYFGKAKR